MLCRLSGRGGKKKKLFMQTKKCSEAAGSFPETGITNAQTGALSFFFISISVSLRFLQRRDALFSERAESEDGFQMSFQAAVTFSDLIEAARGATHCLLKK